MKQNKNIYDPTYVKGLFDSMSKTYGFANYITSFGFTEKWRRQCVDALPQISPRSYGYDFMSGMGESWKFVLNRLDDKGKIIGIDISNEMVSKSLEHKKKLNAQNIEVINGNILSHELATESADYIISTFGVKTFNSDQNKQLSKVITNVLKPGGVLSIIEISNPKGWILGGLFRFYLNVIIPIIGYTFLGNPHDYKMLGAYCKRFGDCKEIASFLEKDGLKVAFKKYFFGCATGVVAIKPKP